MDDTVQEHQADLRMIQCSSTIGAYLVGVLVWELQKYGLKEKMICGVKDGGSNFRHARIGWRLFYKSRQVGAKAKDNIFENMGNNKNYSSNREARHEVLDSKPKKRVVDIQRFCCRVCQLSIFYEQMLSSSISSSEQHIGGTSEFGNELSEYRT